ncbi:dihydrolipoyl dehydrogenase [Bacillus sp. DJP31]|uniref:dihydrolipoyl dehydrogenase n=1 Tax=Bacillus sp. DJP31 TaxID=3409789 RepID=UPI003BB5D6C4
MVVGELAQERDLVIIGGGPGGYHAAIRAAQLGLSVTLVEKNELGGVCLNEGCIPSKILTSSSQKYAELSRLSDVGIEISDHRFNLAKLQQYKQNVVKQLRAGVEALCKANKIELIYGTGYFIAEDKLGVENGHQYDVYKFKDAIIATGCSGKLNKTFNQECIVNEKTIFSLEEIPDHLIVVGSDYISIEIAMCFQALGAKVTLCLQESDFQFDSSINSELTRLCKKMKIQVYKDCKIEDVSKLEEKVYVTFQNKQDRLSIEGSHCFVSNEKQANINDLGIQRFNLLLSSDGFIEIDQQCQTSLPHIYAIGDVTNGRKLAVTAIKQGKVAAEVIAGLASVYNEVLIPTVIHSNPPIGCVGLTEEEAKEEYQSVSVSKFPFHANGYAAVTNQKDGFVKVISDADSGLILGVHIIGSGAIELISSGVIGLEMVVREEDFSFPYYPHPSLNESLLETIEGLSGKSIHLPPQKQKQKKTQSV